MLNKALVFGLFSAIAIGLMTLPAQADTATIQTVTEDVYVEGFDNVWRGSTQQESYTGRANSRADVSTVQDIYRRSTVLGEGNRVQIQNQQSSMTIDRNELRRRSRPSGWR